MNIDSDDSIDSDKIDDKITNLLSSTKNELSNKYFHF